MPVPGEPMAWRPGADPGLPGRFPERRGDRLPGPAYDGAAGHGVPRVDHQGLPRRHRPLGPSHSSSAMTSTSVGISMVLATMEVWESAEP